MSIGVSKYTLDRYDFKEPYRNDICIIRKGVLNKTKLAGVKKFPLPDILPEPKELPLPDSLPLPDARPKINILPGNYIKKDQQFLSRYGKKYNLPKKTFGDIETLLC